MSADRPSEKLQGRLKVFERISDAIVAVDSELLRGQNLVLKFIAQGKPLEKTLDILLRIVEEQSPGMLASILLLDLDGVHVRHGAAPSLPEGYIHAVDGQTIGPAAGSCGTAAYRGEPVIVEDIAADPLWADYRSLALEHGLRACWSTPIFDEQHKVLGTFALYFRKPGRPDQRHLKQIAMVTYTASIAIVKHRVEEALKVREAQLADAQRIAHFGSYEWLPATDTVRWTDELFRIFGLQPGEFQPTLGSYLERVHPEDREFTRNRVEQCVRNGTPFEGEERILRRDGSIRLLLSQGKWLFNENQQTKKLVGTCQDITAHKEAERSQVRLEEELRQIRKMESIGRLAGGIAHDFNNLLTVILGHISLCEQELPPESLVCRHIQQIHQAAQRAATLTRHLLAYSRQQVLQPVVLDLNTVVNNLNEMMTRVIGEHISLHIIAGKALGSIRADLGQIDQILLNLLLNAVDALPKGGDISVETSNTELDENYTKSRPSVNPGRYVMLSVTDTGCGMDGDTMAQIFEPFFTTKAPGEGTGLGLSMVYGAVEQNKGHIAVFSQPGKGTTFKLYFPRTDEAPDPIMSDTEQAFRKGSETILLVEDDEAVRELTTSLLISQGYKVLHANNGESALAVSLKYPHKIHLLLTDVVMPEMSGPDLAAQLKAHRPDLGVLYISGYAGKLLSHHGVFEAEMALLPKPFTKAELLGRISALLQKIS